MKEQIVKTVERFICDEVINDDTIQIKEDDDIIAMGLIDSMGIVRLTAFLQDHFGIKEIDRTDMVLDRFHTVNSIADLVAKYVSTAEAGRS